MDATIRSERPLVKQLEYKLLCRRFVGLDIDDMVALALEYEFQAEVEAIYANARAWMRRRQTRRHGWRAPRARGRGWRIRRTW